MKGLSPWAVSANRHLSGAHTEPVFERNTKILLVQIILQSDSLWLLTKRQDGARVAYRVVYSPGGELAISNLEETENGLSVALTGLTGTFGVSVRLPEKTGELLRYTTRFTANQPLLIPFWPKDVIVLNERNPSIVKGEIHVSQVSGRSGLTWFSLENKPGSVLYFQDLTSLGDYCQVTQTSAADLVGGVWPEIGFSLPVSIKKELPAGQEFIISDAYVAFHNDKPEGTFAKAMQYLDLLATVYRELPLPETKYIDYASLVKKSLDDVRRNHGCWLQFEGKSYLNAYVCDYETPPEIMVQLAVLLPMLDYQDWSKEPLEIDELLLEGLPEFYDEKLKTMNRWLPAAEDMLDRSEEQKREKVMDSWYLHHPLLNLSRLARRGYKAERKLFFDSLDFIIKVAHRFKYKWPVFYHMQTLEVLKAETAPGAGGEKDVAGLYAAVMLQAWELTNDKKYLDEAETAAKTLEQYGLDVFYQANNTAFTAKAMVRLYKITGNEVYLKISYQCIAGIMRNVHLWSCTYGFGKSYPTFFGLYPLKDAPYTAAYEEQEVFSAFHEYLQLAEGIEILPSVRLLLSEFIRHFVNRAAYYYPPMLPDEAISKEVKMGEIDRDLHLALEDLQDGWSPSGTVGHEVYGAGLTFGIVPKHYFQLDGQDLMLCIDYPVSKIKTDAGKRSMTFTVDAEPWVPTRLVIQRSPAKPFPKALQVKAGGKDLDAERNQEYQRSFALKGRVKVRVSW